ncbi:hypothetical protein [Christiangramia sabulilitoris]|uniref:Uncharacterized protein n=1 Tax=Christiangramia sabulilitoris TaxID=2583991 RepID=A0A550I2A3_9FLAO|nr:hypothetical protein [Christiangramia sabulilitoris]TRO65099.1 hypothetical protein FGM01_06750 [Christiangramia sabulilitoris]
MKTKLFFQLILCVLFIGCSIDPIEEDLITNPVESVDAGITDAGCAGIDAAKTITFSEASAIESWDEVRKLYLSLLQPGVSRNGTFDPRIWDIIREFQAKGIGEYSTTYSLNGDCSDSVVLTVNVVPDPADDANNCEAFTAGPDASLEIELSEASAIESWDEVRKLYLSLLAQGIPRDGTFDPTIWNLINAFRNNEVKLGDYSTTYTIEQGDCSDSVKLTIIVIPDKLDEPLCEINAGQDNLIEMTVSQAAAIESWDEVRKLYLSLLERGVPGNGSFDPSIWNLISAFNDPNRESKLGDYTTTYTITDGDCSDSVNLTVRVIAD